MDLLAELRGLFNAPTLTDSQALDRVRASANASTEVATLRTGVSERDATINQLRMELGTLKASAPKGLDPEVLAERSLRVGERADMLAQAGYAPADIGKLKAALIGPDGKPDEVMLARAPGSADCRAANVLNVLRECKPAPAAGHDAAFVQHRQQQQQGGAGEPDRQAELLKDQLKGYGLAAK